MRYAVGRVTRPSQLRGILYHRQRLRQSTLLIPHAWQPVARKLLQLQVLPLRAPGPNAGRSVLGRPQPSG